MIHYFLKTTIYDRPRGKFRFPIDVGQDENYEEAIYRDSNDDIGSYRPHSSNDHSSYDSFDYEGHTNHLIIMLSMIVQKIQEDDVEEII